MAAKLRKVTPLIVFSLAVITCFSHPARAGNRHFAFSYETQTHAKGEREYEQWVTWKAAKDDDSTFDRFDFRHEIEFGITDNWQLAFYVSDWRYQDGHSVAKDGADWRNVAVETIYKVSDANADPLGFALYGEIKAGDRLFELEGKLLFQKNFGNLIAVYNAIIEAEWEGSHLEEDKGEFAQTFGLSHQITHSFNVGVEVLHEVEFDDWDSTGHNIVYVGPNISFRKQGWWVTIAPLVQVSDVHDEANFQTRLLFGIDF